MNLRQLAPLLALTLAAQKPEPQVLRVTTHLVEINVIVRSRNAPVTDLVKDDFRLFEKGTEKKIAFFAVNAAPPIPPRALSVASRPIVAPDLFTNRPSRGERPVNVTVVLLDGMNTDLPDQAYARRQLLGFLRQIRSEDRIAVYALGSRLIVLNDFSSDAGRLVASVAGFSGDNVGLTGADNAAPVADSPAGLANDKIVQDARENLANDLLSDYTIQKRAETTAAALESIAAHIGSIPGRKNLIWITAGFPFLIGHIGDGQANSEDTAFDDDISGVTAAKKGGGGASSGSLLRANDRDGSPARIQKNFTAEALRATRALNDANIAVYPVDARGLTIMPKSMTAERNFGVSRSAAVTPPKGMSTIITGATAMHAVADSTGGIVFNNGNDLRKAIQTAADDGAVTYTLGFYPESSGFDSKFHDLKVQVKRKDIKDLEVRYRKGYTALPDAPAVTQASALASPLEATAIGLTAGREPGSKNLVVSIEPKDISFEQKGDKWTAALDLVFEQRAADGAVLVAANSPIGLNFDNARHDAVFQQGLTITKAIDPAPAATEVRVLVRDRASGRIGTLILPAK